MSDEPQAPRPAIEMEFEKEFQGLRARDRIIKRSIKEIKSYDRRIAEYQARITDIYALRRLSVTTIKTRERYLRPKAAQVVGTRMGVHVPGFPPERETAQEIARQLDEAIRKAEQELAANESTDLGGGDVDLGDDSDDTMDGGTPPADPTPPTNVQG